MIVAIPSIFLILLFSSAVAFVVSRFSYWFTVPLLIFFMAANLLPQQVVLQPLYRMYLWLPLPYWLSDSGVFYDSYVGLIAINVAFQTGFCTFVLANYMKTIPKSLSEAARVDGAGVVRQYFQIILPLCLPALAALATLEFTFIYNEFLWPLILVSTGSKLPITAALNNLQGEFFTDNNLLAAGALDDRAPDAPGVRRPPEVLRQRAHARSEQGMTRIAFIGAGSVVFTKNLLGDILDFPALHEVEIALHDIDPDRLETAEAMARYVAAARGASPTITHAPRPARRDRRLRLRAQHGPDRRPRGDAARLRDPGALRAAPDDRRHARHRRHLPDAAHGRPHARARTTRWPSSARRGVAPELHEPDGGALRARLPGHADEATSSGSATPCRRRSRDLCGARRRPARSEVTFLSAGINHQAFLLRFEHDGESLYPRLDERIAGRSRAAAPRARRALPPLRLLPDRVERARRRVRAVVHAPRRPARALPRPGR